MKKPITLFILLCILCVGRMGAETIPAGTIIYVDVTNFHSDKDGYATSGKYYMSVTASKNADKQVNKSNTSGASWEQYDLNADTEWQELKLLSGNLYAGIVNNESTVGSVSFWRRNKPDDGYNHLWYADACSPNAWDSSKRQFTIASGYTHHDVRNVACFSTTTSSIYLYPVGSTLYLKVNSDWKSGNPRFAACFKGYADDSWVDAAQLGESDYYSITVPEGEWPYVIFCRMNAATTENNWNNKWDQTDNLYAETDKNLCTITGWSNSQTRGVYAPTALIVGAMNDWEVLRGIPLTNGSAKLSLNADAAYPFQIISGESWYGYGDTHHTLTFAGQTTSQALTAGKKDVLLLTASADEYTFTWNEGTKTVSVSHPTVTHPNPNYVYYKNTKGWANVYAHIYGTKETVFPGPQLNSCSFGSDTYYYVALGNNANVVFNQSNNTNQDDLKSIASNKGKYYDPSTTSWKFFSARITLDNQSATSAGTEYKDVELFNTALTTKITCPTKTGYEFGGYWTGKNGTGVRLIEDDGDWIASVSGYTDGDTKWIKESPTVTLYAKWTAKTTTITLHANGGSADGEVVAIYDAALPSFDAITRSQHVLTGYWTSATGGTKVINADGSFAANSGTWNREDGETLELFAQWWGLTTPTVTPTTTNWAGSNVDISLSATSTYLAEPIVVFYVNDGTNTYEVMGAPYGSDGSSLGAIGAEGSSYSTVHKATFTATTYGTYTVTAKLYAGKWIDNFEGSATGWSSLNGSFERVANVERENKNASSTIMKITRNGEGYHTARTTTTETGGTPTDWNYSYDYIHMRFYAKQAEEPKVVYVDDDGENPVKQTTLSSVSANEWHKLAFAVTDGTVNMIYPQILSADKNSIYIDDIILSNESSMTDKVTTASASTTIRNTYTITYKDQFDQEFSGTQTTPPTTHTYGTATTLKIPTKSGYVFGGWYTQSDCSNGAVGTASSASIGATDLADDITLYAQWVTLSTPVVTPASTAWAGSDIAINLSATSTGLPNSVVVFLVNDGTNEYEVMGAPGAVGEEYDYSTTHTATFAAKTYGTYTVTAELYSGKFIDNFEGSASAWSGLGFGTCERVSNVEREADNGSTKVMKITRSTEAGHGEVQETAWTTTEENSGTKTSWDYSFDYIHMRYYTPQAETPKVEYWDDGISVFKNTTLSSQTANTWHELVFAVDGGVVNYIHPFIQSASGNSIYIDDVVLSNEETMTAKVTTASAATTIYSLTSVSVDPTSSADYFDTPIDILLSATSTGLENSVVVFLVNDSTTTFEVVGTPGTPGGSPSYSTTHTATFTTTTPGDYTVTAKLYEGKLIDNFDGALAHWKALEDGSFNASATNPAMQAANGSSTVMEITRGSADYKTVQTKKAANDETTTNWNHDYDYIYMSMYSTTARTPKLKYSDDDSGYEVALDANSLSANTWQRKQFATTHDIDYILPFMLADGTMYIDDIILSNESSMTVKASSVGDATAFRVNDNKYYFTGNNKSSTAWNTVANWNRGEVPSSTSEVFILAPVEIATGTTVHVDKVNIVTGGSITPPNGSSMTASGHLTIAPNAGLNVTGKIRKIADGAALDTRIATTPADLVLESSSAGNASLVFDNDANQATVQMYSKASIPSEDVWNWQFIGIPFTSANALYSYYDSYLYQWTNSGWAEVANGASMSPFTGYCITQDAATTYVMDGTLNPTTSHTFSVPAGVEMVFANSWTAPIYVGAITDEAFEITRKDIYLFNTGYKPEGSGGATANDGKDKYESGTYLTLPIHSAKYTGDSLIAPMQGFYVDNTGGDAGTVTLDYATVVRPAGLRNILAGAMHAPKRTQEQQADDRPTVLKMWANGAKYNDRVVLLERTDFSTGFDNGWDGKKLSFGEVGPSVYVINTLGEPEAVSAIPDLEGTLVGFRAGTNNTCTMSFEYNGEDTFYLNDLQAQQSTQIASENSYTFTCTAGDNEARFVISATPISKTPTDVEPLTAHPSPLTVTKVLLNNHIYIIREGRMFSMDGTLVK